MADDLEAMVAELIAVRRYRGAFSMAGELYIERARSVLDERILALCASGASNEMIAAEIERMGKALGAALIPTCMAAARRVAEPTAPERLQ